MLTLLKNATVYDPEFRGKNDILIAGQKIVQVAPTISIVASGCPLESIDLEGLTVTPGLIDQHVHLLGGGGEGGPSTMTPEARLSDIVLAGVTSVIGCLGTDGVARHVDSLLVKARALENEGLSTYIFTGAYQVPTPTITGDVRSDLIFIDKVIGVGEVAISDHRSSQPTYDQIAQLAAAARVGGMLAGKAGKLHLHVGSGERGLSMIFDIVKNTEIPVEQFVPTHMNRNRKVLEWGVRLGKEGGYVDLTADDPATRAPGDLSAFEAVITLLEAGVPADHITMSSDGNGSAPVFNARGETIGVGVGKIATLTQSLRALVVQGKLPLERALPVVTSNVARCHRLSGKGFLRAGSDADLTVFDSSLNVQSVMAKGRFMVRDSWVEVFGTFERSDNPLHP